MSLPPIGQAHSTVRPEESPPNTERPARTEAMWQTPPQQPPLDGRSHPLQPSREQLLPDEQTPPQGLSSNRQSPPIQLSRRQFLQHQEQRLQERQRQFQRRQEQRRREQRRRNKLPQEQEASSSSIAQTIMVEPQNMASPGVEGQYRPGTSDSEMGVTPYTGPRILQLAWRLGTMDSWEDPNNLDLLHELLERLDARTLTAWVDRNGFGEIKIGCTAIIISGLGPITQDWHDHPIRAHLYEYVRQGGILIVGGYWSNLKANQETKELMKQFFQDFDLPWEICCNYGSGYGNRVIINKQAWAVTEGRIRETEVPAAYDTRVNLLGGVNKRDALYVSRQSTWNTNMPGEGPIHAAAGRGPAAGRGAAEGRGTALAFAKLQKGRIGYIGEFMEEQASGRILAEMLGMPFATRGMSITHLLNTL